MPRALPLPVRLTLLAQADGSPPEAPLSAPSLSRATRYSQPPETTRPEGQEAGARATCRPGSQPCPSPAPAPRAAHFLFSICSCTRRELGTVGLALWVSCSFVYLFNLMICKVTILFLFYTFSSYLTSVWKMILVTVHFFAS